MQDKLAWRLRDMRVLDLIRTARDAMLLRQAKRAGLIIGQGVRIMGRPSFGDEPCLVSIGNRVTISTEVLFITHDGGTWVFRRQPRYADLQRFGRIDIEDNCFIGARAILMPGIRIGANSIVAAGAVVTKSVPNDTVVGGVPARTICTVDEYIARSAPRCVHCPPALQRNAAAFQRLLQDHHPYVPPSRTPGTYATART